MNARRSEAGSEGARLDPQEWMTAPETLMVLAALDGEGGPARFVGGCVRDAILRRPVEDVDLATPLPPDEAMRRLAAAGLRAIPTGIEHGTVTALAGGRRYEITTLRRDVETDGRRARVAFTDDWQADAARRDFTMNAISCDADGTLYDYFDGLADLAAGIVRFVGEPEARIREDVLRILRFFRFHARYGRGAPDPGALAACARLAELVPGLSKERVSAELKKILMTRDPVGVLALMRDTGVLVHVVPEAGRLRRLDALVRLEHELEERSEPIRRLAALVRTDTAGARALGILLRLSNAERDRLVELVTPDWDVDPQAGESERRQALHRLGAARYRDLVLLDWAGRLADQSTLPPALTAGYRVLLRTAELWRPIEFPLKGADVVAAGVPAGPRVGQVLARVERWWEAGDFRADRAACLARLQAVLADAPADPL